MSETSSELQFGDVSELAHKVREAIGVGDFETVEVILPQFDRTDKRTISVLPKDAAWLDTLKSAPLDILRDLGLQCWDMNLWLFPAEWYEYIPEGYEIIDLNFNVESFRKGETDNDRRFGVLAYGILVEEPSAEVSISDE